MGCIYFVEEFSMAFLLSSFSLHGLFLEDMVARYFKPGKVEQKSFINMQIDSTYGKLHLTLLFVVS